MDLATLYANAANCELDRPFINLQYFSLPCEKYIVLHAGGGNDNKFPAKIYDLYGDVVNLILPYLKTAGIEIVQLGGGNERPVNNTINLLGKTTIHQTAYIISHSLLMCGNDSCLAHFAGHFGIPEVILYGPTSKPHFPHWFNHEKSIFLESHRFGNTPSYAANEQPKTINLLKTELVAKSTLAILNIPHTITQNTIMVGAAYAEAFMEIVPDAVVPPQGLPPGNVVIRADYLFDINSIIGNLQQRPYILSLNQPIDIQILKQLKPNIPLIIYDIDASTDVKYLQEIIKLGIPLNLTTKLNDNDWNARKLEFLDLPLVRQIKDVTLDEVFGAIAKYNNVPENGCADFINKPLKYRSKKYIISGGKIYLSKYDWMKQVPVANVEESSIANLSDQTFMNEMAHFLIFVE